MVEEMIGSDNGGFVGRWQGSHWRRTRMERSEGFLPDGRVWKGVLVMGYEIGDGVWI